MTKLQEIAKREEWLKESELKAAIPSKRHIAEMEIGLHKAVLERLNSELPQTNQLKLF